MRTLRHVPAVLLALALLLAACGDDGGQPAGDPSDGTQEEATGGNGNGPDDGDGNGPDDGEGEGDDGNGGATGTGAAGTVEVDGVTYGIDETLRCEPFELEDSPIETTFELELQGLGTSGSDRTQIDVSITDIAGTSFDDVSWSGPEGVFGSPDDAQVDWSGDRVTGSATLVEAWGGDEAIDVTFDLAVPGDLFACR